jgi:ubiquinone biosynthesis protein
VKGNGDGAVAPSDAVEEIKVPAAKGTSGSTEAEGNDAATAEKKTKAEADARETIGLLGVRRLSDENLTIKDKGERLAEIVGIARHYDMLHGLDPVSFRQLLEELGPTFVKAGQILSMRSEILPDSFLQELTKLRSNVEPMSLEVVLDTLQREYILPLNQIFESIDDAPLGSASVAQVHTATLVSGERVAVKVQRPGIKQTMAQDIDIMRTLARQVRHLMGGDEFVNLEDVVDELWLSFRDETDFMNEARALEEFKANCRKSKVVTCPTPHMELCTEHVVVMDYVQGIHIDRYGDLIKEGYDISEIGEKLVDNYAVQLLDDGFFHADPHPGNVLIVDRKICYIDLGIMGRITSHERGALNDMVEAVASSNIPLLKDGILRFAINSDSPDIDHARLLYELDALVANYGNTSLGELDLARVLAAIVALARRTGIELPRSVTMLARSVVTLEGTVTDMLGDESVIEIFARHVALHQDTKQLVEDELMTYVNEARLASHGLLRALAEADLALNMLTRGQLKVNMQMPGTDDPIADFSHAFDRLTSGIVIAGLFIGSSVIYFSGTKPRVFGIPLIGLIGFLVAFVLGIGLVFDIIRETRGRKK